MPQTRSLDPMEHHDAPVGSFTGFGNFFMKECRDWWKSLRLIVIFAIPTLILVLIVFTYETEAPYKELRATRIVLGFLLDHRLTVLLIFILIFSTMGILTVEKSTGTLAWNLTKPLGRTGLFAAKWLVATLAFWLAACVLPILIASICMIAAHGVTPDFAKMVPVIGAAVIWIGLWVLLVLTISLGFQSQGAVGGITIAFWAVPNLLGFLMGEVLGKETAEWVLARLGTNAPFFLPEIVGDKSLFFFRQPEWKNVWLYSLAGWYLVLGILSLRIFNRQEVGS